MSLRIYHDNLVEGDWFKRLSPVLSGAEFAKIEGRGQNPPRIDALVEYDRPDIVLTKDGSPVLVLEKTREVPSSHNVLQRLARLVRAAELGVPAIKFLPFDAMKHGKHAHKCRLNIRLLDAFKNMKRIHDVPVFAVNWPCDTDWELINDGSENERLRELIHSYVISDFDGACPAFEEQWRRNRKEYKERLKDWPKYADPPGAVEIVGTSVLMDRLADRISASAKRVLEARGESVVYTIAMSPGSCKRQDPYTGAQFVYDYNRCRTGEAITDKRRNLILRFPKIDRGTWHRKNPNDPTRKSCNWYLTANAFIFKDDVEVLRS